MKYMIVFVIGRHGKDVVEKFDKQEDAIARFNEVLEKVIKVTNCSNIGLYQIVAPKKISVTTWFAMYDSLCAHHLDKQCHLRFFRGLEVPGEETPDALKFTDEEIAECHKFPTE